MSHIYDALQRARREREAGGRESLQPPSPQPAPLEATLRSFSDKGVPLVRLTSDGRAALSRSYAALERICSRDRGLVLGPGSNVVRTVLVTGNRSAVTALALAATLVEKTRARVVLANAAPATHGLAELVTSEAGSLGFWDLAMRQVEPERCLCRTELAGLYFLSAGTLPVRGNGDLSSAGLAQALSELLQYFSFVVVHGGTSLEPQGTGTLERSVEGVVVVTDGSEGADKETTFGGGLPGRPIRILTELR
jgi:hypothetical protein